jgi:O-antigen/teichoic acid export membrane protein
LAWGSTISGVIGVSVALWLSRHELAIFRLSLKEWRGVVAFGLFGSATAIIYRLSDAVVFLVFGKMLDTRAVGLLQRAFTLSGFPQTVILAGVNAVALPAFSHKARSGADLKETYLSAVSHVAAVQWPALAFISAMATPLTLFVLGPRWMAVAPLAQIVAPALMFNFTSTLNFPILVAMGAIRKTLPVAIVQVVLSQVITIWAASMGLRAIAFSAFATAPLGLILWMGLVRKHIPFSLGELFVALHKSLIVLLASAIGPIAVLIYSNGAPSIPEAGAAGVLWLAGWLLAIRATRHPLRNELGKAPGFIARRLTQKKSA